MALNWGVFAIATIFKKRPAAALDWWPAESENLYELWTTEPAEVIAHLEHEALFTSAEIAAAAFWSAKQSSWGLRASLCEDGALIEVFGPDELVPQCIIYSAQNGVQTDDFDGVSRVYPCLETALQAIAPLR